MMEGTTRGVVLIVWGKRGYGFAAYNLAVSLKYHSPSIPITLIAHPETMAQVPDRSVFDDIIWDENFVNDPGRFKVGIYNKLPYDYNLYLDVDAFCFRPIDRLFDRLIAEGGHYYTFINTVYDQYAPNALPQMLWAWKDDIWAHYGLSDHKLPATQSSIQFIKKCPESEDLFRTIEQCFDNPIPLERLRDRWGGTQPDELYLNVALALKGIAPHIGTDVMWFGNNASQKPAILKSQYYFLSFFGSRSKIRPMFWSHYDSELIKMCASRGGRHVFKQNYIKADKHANKKAGQIRTQTMPPKLPIATQPAIKREGTTHLFMSYFQTSDNQRRNHELNKVMQANIECRSITKIFNLGSHYEHPKVVNLPHERPTYTQFVKAVNENCGDYNIIANSDIYFTDEIDHIKSIDFHNTALALSRYNVIGQRKELFNHKESQDTWIFKGKVKQVQNCDFVMGKPACDNRFAYELAAVGYRVINPSIDIKTYHLHEVNKRSYTESDRLPGAVLYIKPESAQNYYIKKLLLHQPGKVGDILICAPIVKYYHDQGFDVLWQAPAQYHSLIRQLGYATPVDRPLGRIDKTIDLSFGVLQNTSMHIWWLKNKSSFQTFVHAKYHLAGMDVKERYNLQYNRNETRENDLYSALQLNDNSDYIIYHGSSDYGTPAPSPDRTIHNVIDFTPVGDFTVLDWRKVIEKAREIHCIDSSLANFVEVLNPSCRKVFYRVPERKTESWFDFNKWEVVDMNLMVLR